jgi:hypothetical protein
MTQPSEAAQYEFNEPQNKTIQKLAQGMKFMGIFWVIAGGFTFLGVIANVVAHQIGNAVGTAAIATFILFLGVRCLSGSGSFFKVVRTQGNDITNLMDALEQLRRFFLMWTIFAIIYLAFIVLGIVLVIIGLSAVAAQGPPL